MSLSTSSLKRSFQRGTAAVCTALVAAVPVVSFNANAHVLPGSILEPYIGFVNAMVRSDGMSCCNKKDGQGGVAENPIKDASGKVIGYQIKFVNDESGNPLDHPVWRNVPARAILQFRDAVAFCKNLKETDPTNPDVPTCKVPTVTAVWTNHIPHNASDDPDAQDFTIYCYLPQARFQ